MLEKGLSAQSRTTVTNENTAARDGIGRPARIRHAFDGGADGKRRHDSRGGRIACRLDDRGRGDERHPYQTFGLGAEITATAVLTEVEGRKLTFNVGARDAGGMIGEGVHIRYVVDCEKFMAKLG